MQKTRKKQERKFEDIIRVASVDLPLSKSIYTALTRVKGVSWMMSNAILERLNIPREKKVGELTKEDIKKIEDFIHNKISNLPVWMLNRRKDRETGENSHATGTKLELANEFDIRRLKKIKSYRGSRHTLGLPVRGQRTKAHFRHGGRAIGVERAKAKKR